MPLHHQSLAELQTNMQFAPWVISCGSWIVIQTAQINRRRVKKVETWERGRPYRVMISAGIFGIIVLGEGGVAAHSLTSNLRHLPAPTKLEPGGGKLVTGMCSDSYDFKNRLDHKSSSSRKLTPFPPNASKNLMNGLGNLLGRASWVFQKAHWEYLMGFPPF